MPSGHKFWSLGHSFLTNYYMLFDMDNYMIGLAGRTELGGLGLKIYQIALIVAGSLVAVAIIVLVLVWIICLKNRRIRENQELEQPLLTFPGSGLDAKPAAKLQPYNPF